MGQTTVEGLVVDAPVGKPAADDKPMTMDEKRLHEAILHLRRGHTYACLETLVDAINVMAAANSINATAAIAGKR